MFKRKAFEKKNPLGLDIPCLYKIGGMGVVQRFDYVFWMGDLNYRTNLGLNKTALAKSLLAKPDVDLGVRYGW